MKTTTYGIIALLLIVVLVAGCIGAQKQKETSTTEKQPATAPANEQPAVSAEPTEVADADIAAPSTNETDESGTLSNEEVIPPQ